MPNTSRDPNDLLPLSPPVYHILLALGREPLHGYAIMHQFEERTGGREVLLPGTLYSTLARMTESCLIEETTDRPNSGDDKRRRYYRLTEFGRAVARAESDRMRALLDLAREQDLLPDLAG